MEDEANEQPKGGSPTWLALVAAVTFVMLTLLSLRAVASHFLSSTNGERGSAPEPFQPVADVEKHAPPIEHLSPGGSAWISSLYASECPTPCSAGPHCQRTPENSHAICGTLGATCKACPSKMGCIPGHPDVDLALDEEWLLHLSAIYFEDKRRPNSAENPCPRSDDMYLCVRPSGAETWQCLSQMEACRNGNQSVAAIPVGVKQLVETGIDVSVRLGTEHGPEIARRDGGNFRSGLRRRGLCSGFKLDLEGTGSDFVWFTFFLQPSRP